MRIKELGWRRISLAVLFFLASAILEIQSALQSAEFHRGIATGYWSYILAVGGAALDYGQIGFPIAAIIAWGKEKYIRAIVFWIFTVLVAGYSLFTSMVCNVNWNNETINDISAQAQKNEIYKKSSTSFDIASANVQQLQSMLDEKVKSRKADEEKLRQEYSPKIESAKARKYIDQNNNGVVDSVREFESERDKRISKLDTDISELQKQIDTKMNNLESSKQEMASVVSSTRPTRGLMGIAELISKEDPESVALKINIIKETLIVLTGIGFSIGVGILLDSSNRFWIPTNQSTDPLPPTSPDETPRFRFKRKKSTNQSVDKPIPLIEKNQSFNQPIPATTNQLIEPETPRSRQLTVVKTKEEEFNELVKKYMEVMEDKENPGTCKGYGRIAKEMGISQHLAGKIKGVLEDKGIIKVDGGQTKIVKNKKSNLA